MVLESEEVSYLRPRDPSLDEAYLSFESIKINLAQSKPPVECLGKKKQVPGSMQIYLRMKKTEEEPHELFEGDEKTIVCRAPGAEFERRYKFSNIFKVNSSQAELFNLVVKPKVFQFIDGKSSSLLTYGASGSGKTYTIMGTAAEPGIIPRTLEYLFNSLPNIPDIVSFKPDAVDSIVYLSPAAQAEQKRIHDQLLHTSRSAIDKHHIQTYKVMQQRLSTEPCATFDDQGDLFLGIWVSFAEIYNEDVFDLLDSSQTSKKSREKLIIKMTGARPYIKDLTTVSVSNSLEAYQILQYGLHNLKYAATCVNFHSSRSHSVFTIKLVQGSKKTKEYTVSYFNFCDLAGSERLKRTLNTGKRLKESNSINTSLLVLGKCIRSILSSQKFKDNRPVPYRESKLTQLFQRALCGLEDIAMIVNITLEKEVFEETLHSLNFSAIAREVKVKNTTKIVKQMENLAFEQHEEGDTSQDDAEMKELEDLILYLTDELEVREDEFRDRMILMRSQMINEYSEAAARADKAYEKEVERIKDYYDDLFHEEFELWKNNYKESSVVNVVTKSDTIDLDSSDEEKISNVNIANKTDIIVIDSSDEEEPIKVLPPLFEQFHSDSDGKVLSSLFEEFESDRDGKVLATQFEEFESDSDGKVLPSLSEEFDSDSDRKVLPSLFEEFNSDSDQKGLPPQFQEFNSDSDGKVLPSQFEKFDSDSDGKVSPSLSEEFDSDSDRKVLPSLFEEFNSDSDQKGLPSEFQEFNSDSDGKVLPSLFQEFNSDNDGNVSQLLFEEDKNTV